RPSSAESPTAPTRGLVQLRPFRVDVGRSAQVVLAATVVGLLTGFFGVGGGFALVPALVLALSYPMRVAVGTSLLVIGINSATAVATRVADAQVDWATVGLFTAAAVLGSLVGGRLAARVRPQVLTRAFAVLLLGVATYVAVQSVPHVLA
ncbi:MAG TPA: sulfite exporter TauE/SafE family protein, partial [Actinomycetales bacterium]|nr:sulfite exporter TauE/SafE family protein [Actinomycetales bacterium]